jgi:hypothetical protein
MIKSRESFTFNRKYKLFEEDVLDLSVINGEVPKPDAQVDIEVAWREYERDLKNVADIYAWGAAQPSIEGNWRILLNHRDWSHFWSVRHPDAAVREQEKLELRECEASVQRIAGKPVSVCQRRMRG